MTRLAGIDITVAQPGGASPKQAFEWKPLNVARMNWRHRQTQVEAAPSLIGGNHVPAPGERNE